MLEFIGRIFITHPYVAAVPAIIFGLFYLKIKSKLLLALSISWVLYAIYEELILLRFICSGECNIRVDLLLIYPILLLLSVIGLVYGFIKITKNK